MSYMLRECPFPKCTNKEDPRFGGFCDGHDDESRRVFVPICRRLKETEAKLKRAVTLIDCLCDWLPERTDVEDPDDLKDLAMLKRATKDFLASLDAQGDET